MPIYNSNDLSIRFDKGGSIDENLLDTKARYDYRDK